MDLDETRDDSLHLPDPNAHKANRQQGKPLESLLMAKNAKLQDDLTLLRVGPACSFLSARLTGSGRT